MDNRPIGIFDSGVGGLSAVRQLVRCAPQESFVYLGDTARVPYGDRTPENIRRLSRQNARFLRTNNVKAILVACNTSTANAMEQLVGDNRDIPVIGAVQPAAEQAAATSRSGKIGVIATNAVVRSGSYEAAIHGLCPTAQVTAVGCPKLVPLIEAGHRSFSDEPLRQALDEYLTALCQADVDTVVLGCTHYPLIAEAVQEKMGPSVSLVASGEASVASCLKALAAVDGLADPARQGSQQFYCSARPQSFSQVAELFLGYPIGAITQEIDIEMY
jgi:glutamate racemase